MHAMILAAAMAAALPMAAIGSGPRVTTSAGQVQGKAMGGVEAFLGIPYGADTGGANRFQPPQPPAPWSGVRPAVQMGARCPQVNHAVPFGLITFSDAPVSEDCLVLNIWAPAKKTGRRAVMVWVHGGGYGFGSANDPMYDGTGLARNEGVVVVSLNHRLNALGYLNLGPEAGPDYSGAANVGQLDIVQALRWVKANIARFGGDPANVTLFGQSGGGAKIAVLLAMPSAQGLFGRAIIASGAKIREQTPAEALAVRDALLARLGLKPAEVLKLRDVPIADLSAAVDAVGPLAFKPWIDGAVIPRQPFAPDAPATARGVAVMVGTAHDEATTLLIGNPAWSKMDEPAVRMAIAPLVGPANADRALALYKARSPVDTPPQLYAAIFSDVGFTHIAQVLATRQAAGGAPVFAYRTDWRTPVLDGVLRSPHGVELPFVFDTVGTSAALVGTQPQPAMVRLYQQSFANFAKSGTPSGAGLPAWPRYDAQRRSTFVFDTKPHVVDDPDPALRAFWDEVTKEPAVAPAP